jgi:glucosamine kinase
MILIADSGSTKTTWCLAALQPETRQMILTSGINPYYQTGEEILSTLQNEFTAGSQGVKAIWFYGAGCINPTVNEVVSGALYSFFGTETIEVGTDLMAAARALCGHQPGIACILGTGSNSCYYDGETIANHVSPLGFILGDEASGAVLGRKLLGDVLKKQLPSHLLEAFYAENPVTQAEIMENIYRKPFPNRYAARFSRFLYAHISEPAIRDLVSVEFGSFFRRNVLQYPEALQYAVHFSGSIAFYFQDLLRKVAADLGLRTGRIVQDPIQGLVDFHLNTEK